MTTTDAGSGDPAAAKAAAKALRKQRAKEMKESRRLKREGKAGQECGSKTCESCGKSADLLIRCQHKGTQGKWQLVCGDCWKKASGGVVDGDADHPDYRYGGLWKNRAVKKNK